MRGPDVLGIILTPLDYACVRYDNNLTEGQIRPAVILPKNSRSNRSDRGAHPNHCVALVDLGKVTATLLVNWISRLNHE